MRWIGLKQPQRRAGPASSSPFKRARPRPSLIRPLSNLLAMFHSFFHFLLFLVIFIFSSFYLLFLASHFLYFFIFYFFPPSFLRETVKHFFRFLSRLLGLCGVAPMSSHCKDVRNMPDPAWCNGTDVQFSCLPTTCRVVLQATQQSQPLEPSSNTHWPNHSAPLAHDAAHVLYCEPNVLLPARAYAREQSNRQNR